MVIEFGKQSYDLLFIAHIGSIGTSLPTSSPDRRHHLLSGCMVLTVGDADSIPLLGSHAGGGSTNTAATTGYQDCLGHELPMLPTHGIDHRFDLCCIGIIDHHRWQP